MLKLKPDNESLTILALPLGAIFDIEETYGEWIKVKIPPDKNGIVLIGYVNMSFVELKLATIDKKPSLTFESKSAALNQEDAYLKWKTNFAQAKQKETTGIVLMLAGTAVLIPSLIYSFYNENEENIREGRTLSGGGWALVIIGDVVGIGGFFTGLIFITSAYSRQKQLYEEGRFKGYIKAGMIPKYRAIGIQIGAEF